MCGIMERQEAIIDINKSTVKPTRRKISAFPGFCYKNGYTLSIADLGKAGVKIEVADAYEDSAAVILPPAKTKECNRWLSKTLGQKDRELPQELPKILKRLLAVKKPGRILERGDKKVVKEALKQLELEGIRNN